MSVDTSNKFMVATTPGNRVRIMFPPRGDLDREEALVLASWLVAMADGSEEQFPKILSAVQNT